MSAPLSSHGPFVLPEPLAELGAMLGLPLAWAGSALTGVLGLVLENILAIGTVGAALFLVAEVIARRTPVADPRVPYLAERLELPDAWVTPIADGIQLWRDTLNLCRWPAPRGHRGTAASPAAATSAAETIPPGAPTLKGSYLVRTPCGLMVVAIHNLADMPMVRDPRNPERASTALTLYDGNTGALLRQHLAFSIDEDIARRVALIERLATEHFGTDLRGEIQPLVLYTTMTGRHRHDGQPLTAGTRLISGAPVPHVNLDSPTALSAHIATIPQGRIADAQIVRLFDRFSALLLSQPARMTPRGALLRRSLVGAACLGLWIAQGPGLSTDMIAQAIGMLAGLLPQS